MLFFASILYIIYSFFDDFVNPWCINNNCKPKFSLTEEVISLMTMGVGDFFFGEAHWLLAFNYFKIAKNQQRQMAGDQVKDYKTMLVVGVIGKAVMPLAEIAFCMWRDLSDRNEGNPLAQNLYTLVKSLTEGTWIVSGIILIWSVNSIRKSMVSQSDGQTINVTNLVIHSSAFALFIISVLINLYFFDKMNIVWNGTN